MVLVGDSIRLGYAPRVAERLSGKAVVISPAENGGDSANVLSQLDEWVLSTDPPSSGQRSIVSLLPVGYGKALASLAREGDNQPASICRLPWRRVPVVRRS